MLYYNVTTLSTLACLTLIHLLDPHTKGASLGPSHQVNVGKYSGKSPFEWKAAELYHWMMFRVARRPGNTGVSRSPGTVWRDAQRGIGPYFSASMGNG
ncbi:hypothetical protein FKM82_020740 [Ascaphus truei]